MEAIKNFLTKETQITAGFSVQTWMFIALGVAVVLIAIIIASAVKNSKKNVAKSEEPEEITVKENYIPEDYEESEETSENTAAEAETACVVAEDTAVVEASEPIEEKAVVEDEPVEEKAVAVEEPIVAEEAPAKAPETEPVKEESAKDEQTVVATEVKSAPKAEKKAAPKKKAEKIAAVEPISAAEEPEVVAEPAQEAEVAATVDEESEKKSIGKFEICNSVGGFRYILVANNGQLLYESRDYKNIDSCKEAVAKFTNAAVNGEFKVRADKFGLFKFNLKSPTSNNMVYVGESYKTKKACLNIVESVKHFAPVSPVVDITEADYVAKAMVFDIPAEVREAVEAGQGATGKWEIALSEPDTAKSPYVYLLYANNGQLLYESREYKSMDSCKSGLDTFVKTVKDGAFIVDEDKFGRYKFILRSRRAGSQVEYIGQNYADKTACMSSAISVYKFALLTPIE